MTPKEKAYKICDDLCWIMGYGNLEKEVKDVALFLLDEMINELEGTNSTKEGGFFWEQVKQEIEKL